MPELSTTTSTLTSPAPSPMPSELPGKKTFRAAVVGGTGYSGQELMRLLSNHPQISSLSVGSRTYAGSEFGEVYPNFKKHSKLVCSDAEADLQKLAHECDVVFLALPSGVAAAKLASLKLGGAAFNNATSKIIDLSGDFRLSTAGLYKQWHKQPHPCVELLPSAVYGLPELNRSSIGQANFIANPGCYATAAILALYPLVKAGLLVENSIIMDGKSGVSGAGRSLSLSTHFNECNESVKAYQSPTHRHTPEIEQALGQYTIRPVKSTFTAHLVPMNRGILMTTYASLKYMVSQDEVTQIFQDAYGQEPFIRLLGTSAGSNGFPETRWVKGSNFLDIGFVVDERCARIVVVSALDNLMKGAAGQAVQNMNIVLGLPETSGLDAIPLFPS